MNRRMILFMPLRILTAEALLLLLPAGISFIYREPCAWVFLLCAAGGLAVSVPLSFLVRPRDKVIYAKEGFVIVALSWVLLSAFGALPFRISGEIPHYVDALFETVSGFTTTGASILRDVTLLSRGMLFWRSFTHWLGGMGILVFLMTLTNMSDRPIHIMRAEMPGPIVGKLVPRAKETAKILYLIYLAMTVLEIVLLTLGKMPLFEAVIHSMGTAGTGGFGLKPDSLSSYNSFLQWVVTVFMFLFGVNFNLYYLLLIRRWRDVAKSNELWTYAGIGVAAVVIITPNIMGMCKNFPTALRLAAFQVSSIMTTTGFSTTDFNLWPQFSKTVLLLLMFIGACAGSTAGGLKVSRVIILFKVIRRELQKLLHPRAVRVIRMEGKKVEDAVISNTCSYLAVYVVCLLTCFLIVSMDRVDMETAFSATAACFNNIGPAFGLAGPMASYADFDILSKLTLTASMLLGRLEIFPLLLALAPTTWIRK